MVTCVCSQERAEGSQNATARPSGRQLHHTLAHQAGEVVEHAQDRVDVLDAEGI